MQPETAQRRFRPSLLSTLVLGGLALAFAALGNWQLDRADEKQATQRQFDTAPSFDHLPPAAEAARFARVRVFGRFDTERHLLIDNQLLRGRPGVHALTPFQLQDGRWLLVNRGWLPLPPDRRMLPPVATPDGIQQLAGSLDEMYRPGRKIGADDDIRQDAWPQLLTYPDIDRIGEALGVRLYPLVLLLDEAQPGGFEGRDWKPVNTGAQKHRARALQWFTFLVTALVIWCYLGLRRGKET